MDDRDFGTIRFGIDGWDGEISFNRPISGTQRLRVHIRSGTNGPSEGQRGLFRELRRRYNSLWPRVAERIVMLRRETVDVKSLPTLLRSTVGLSIPGVFGGRLVDFILVYEFKDDETRKGYFISFASWNIESADDAM